MSEAEFFAAHPGRVEMGFRSAFWWGDDGDHASVIVDRMDPLWADRLWGELHIAIEPAT